MQLYNTLTHSLETFTPIDGNKVRIYSCGPTVYDHIHIGNLRAFVVADVLRRVLAASGYDILHVMNFTDVDDKTIARSTETYADEVPETALKKLTRTYEDIFLADMSRVGNDTENVKFVRATESINAMQKLIIKLYEVGVAYIADDGVYFSIEKYRLSGNTYGQLLSISAESTNTARIDNDEYDKDSIHDFALWKKQKPGEPAWEFTLDNHDLHGRPGWHIECSAMSAGNLGQPFDIHTGGVDLIFPHHENEIAQSTAAAEANIYARYFVHNEHLLVEGKKMSKSLNNFYTLRDIEEKGFSPIAFRLSVLQSHYRSPTNFSWDNLEAAQNRLKNLQSICDYVFQPQTAAQLLDDDYFQQASKRLLATLQDGLDTPEALKQVNETLATVERTGLHPSSTIEFVSYIALLDSVLGLQLGAHSDLNNEQKEILQKREKARSDKEWSKADELRQHLQEQGVQVKDTDYGQVWSRI